MDRDTHLYAWRKIRAPVYRDSAAAGYHRVCSRGSSQRRNRSCPCGVERHIRTLRACMAGTLRQTCVRLAKFLHSCPRKREGRTSLTVAGPLLARFPIQSATSMTFGTVADTTMNRTAFPRSFIRETTTSSVLPRDSLRRWTCSLERDRGVKLEEEAYLVNKEELDLRENVFVVLPVDNESDQCHPRQSVSSLPVTC